MKKTKQRIALLIEFNEVCKAVGGVGEVARLCRQKSSAIGNWRRRKQFPSKYFFVIQTALEYVDCVASLHLFGFVRPHRMSKGRVAVLQAAMKDFTKRR
jgi:hypothetical protein